MFGISMYELGLIALIGLIFLGPRQLAETAKVAGKIIRELQKMASDVQSSINLDLDPTPKPPPYSPYNYDSATTGLSSPTPSNQNLDNTLKASDGEKIGPDFYAELLASSAEPELDPATEPAKPEENKKEEKQEEQTTQPVS
ncbi:MAG: Sec-independent protein translocase subunit TatA/TatB [Desulfomonilaceae bacterium]